MKYKPRRYLLIGVAICLIFFGFFVINNVGVFTLSNSTLIAFESYIRNKNQQSNYVQCQEDRASLLVQLSSLKSLSDENARLRELVHFVDTIKPDYTVANVTARDAVNTSLLYIDKGSNDGIAVGQPATVSTGVIVGKVVRTGTENAVVQLLVDDGSRLAVKAAGSRTTTGIAQGHLGSSLTMDFIVDEKSISISDQIVTSGLEPHIQAGLLVGSVKKITTSADQVFTSADLEPAFDYQIISILTILRST